MPVIHNIPLSLKTKEVLRREGIREYSKLGLKMKALIRELLASINNNHLLEPAIAYEIYSITEVGHHQLSLESNAALHGPLLSSVLAEAKELAAVVYTIGPRLEVKATDYFDRSEPLRGVLLDGIGNAAVDSLTQEVCKFMTSEASSRGYQASSPLNPGMPGFPISEQRQLFKLVPAQKIGVRLTSQEMMSPRKSLSIVFGMGPEMPTWTQAEACNRCNLKKTCRYRLHLGSETGIEMK